MTTAAPNTPSESSGRYTGRWASSRTLPACAVARSLTPQPAARRCGGGPFMSLNAFALILLAGLIHAGWNIAAKKAGGDARFAFFTSVLMMLVWAPLGWWLGRDAVPLWGAREWAIVALSGVLTGIFIASYTVVDGYAVKAMLLSPVLVD